MSGARWSTHWVRSGYSNRLIPVVIGDRTRLPTSEIPWIVRRLPGLHLDDRGGGEAQFDLIASAVRGHA